MKIKDIITEKLSSIVYHGTPIQNSYDILTNSRFKLSTAIKSPEDKREQELFDPKRPYYFSTARSRQSYYLLRELSRHDTNVVFVMNGDWFNKRYKAAPTNFFTKSKKQDEMEDRVFHYRPYINFSNKEKELIKEIYIVLRHEFGTYVSPALKKEMAYIEFLIDYTEKNNIPLKIYTSLILMSKNKSTITIKELKNMIDQYEKNNSDIKNKESTPIMDYIELNMKIITELIKINSNTKLNKKQYEFLTDRYLKDALINTIEIYHKKEPESLQPIIQLYRRQNIKNIYELMLYLQNKFKDQLDENT